jgi:hypothetical protein
MTMQNRLFYIEDDGGAKYLVVAETEQEANSFVLEDLGFTEEEYRIVSSKELDPSKTPCLDDFGKECGLMSENMSEKGIFSCSEW